MNKDMIKFARKWELLTKYQKSFILKLSEDDLEGSLNNIMGELGFKNNGMKFNDSVHMLEELKIISSTETDKKSRGRNGKIIHYHLNDEWVDILINADIEVKGNKLNY